MILAFSLLEQASERKILLLHSFQIIQQVIAVGMSNVLRNFVSL